MTQNEIIMIAGMALVTFLVRYPILATFGKIALPAPVFTALKYVPAAVLTAIIAPGVLMPDGQTLNISPANSELIAGVVAALVAWRTRNLLLTIIVGMVTLWVWRALFPA